uniref:WGS project CAEQ00000000 data, annotated contig 14 n=1 Tax=Trypanosoma congolense (strain IL3000) TaxID=1068625 RepID=F9W6M4_TRYCI|nr:unnamed protein product [Trypanosoma congolense IL3000]
MKQRKLWQKLHEQKGLVEKAKDDYALARGQLERVTRLDIRQGLQSLQEVLEELNNPRLRKAVHGQVIDLIDVSKGYETAVEVTAGNALFNVVVDSFEVSAMLLDQMNSRRKPGRVSFFPLDTCSGSSLVNIEGSDGSLLADHISCGSMFGGIIAELFGSTVVVASIENGERVARKYGCDAVTLEGDQVSRRGGITGGFIESRSLKITSFNAKKDTAAKLLREEEVLAGLSEEVTTIDKEVSDVKNELESLMEEMSRLEKTSDIGRDSFAHSQRRIRLERQKEELHVARRTLEMNIDCNQSSIASLQQEAKEALKPSWTDDDERQLERLMDDAKNHRKKISDLTVQSVKLATSAQVKEHSRNNARSRLSILTNRLCELGWTSALSNAMLSEQASCDNAISSITKRLKEVQKLIDEAVRQEQESKEALETLRGELDVVSRFAQEQQELNDMNRMNRSFYVQQRDEAMEKIKRLGSLPASKENYSGMSLAMLMSHHMKCKEKLKKYSHVNRKAADQYTALMGTKEDLAKQEGNLQEELKSIRELMDHLDQKKDEAVERTYKQIQYQFEEVFKELVATDDCHGQLQLIWSNARKEAGEDPYVAAQINVSFGHGASVTDLKQLSGGQKSLVALALIFAIQRCDPAPFYLFDEIDAALDAEYRMSVARLLAKESKNCQFITATFKNEMLEVADHVLGVFFHNKISRIQAITIEEGTKLLKQAALEERKRVRESNE